MAEIVGGWSGWNFDITLKEIALFQEVMKSVFGVKYRPLAVATQVVATQVVAGLNYAFLSEGTAAYPEAPHNVFVIVIYAPPPGQGAPHLSSITKVTP